MQVLNYITFRGNITRKLTSKQEKLYDRFARLKNILESLLQIITTKLSFIFNYDYNFLIKVIIY